MLDYTLDLIICLFVGNCNGNGHNNTECASLPPVVESEYIEDDNCLPPCGTGETCQEPRCQSVGPCGPECKSCSDLGFNDPCQVLDDALFGRTC